jgi:hypothetical protein
MEARYLEYQKAAHFLDVVTKSIIHLSIIGTGINRHVSSRYGLQSCLM